MSKIPVGLILILLYAAGFAYSAWMADPPDEGPGAATVMLFGFLWLGGYLFARFVSWLLYGPRRRVEARGFEVRVQDADPLPGPPPEYRGRE